MKNYQLACSSWGTEEVDAINKIIRQEQFTMGESVLRFEHEFSKKFHRRYSVMVNSGSSANLLAIAALCYKKDNPLKSGDEIIVPSLSWSTTYYPVHQYNMRLVFVDIDKNTLNIDINEVEGAITDKTKAIFVPSILGNPAHLLELKEICSQYNLYLIEDNCESMGAKLGDNYVGTFGICSTFSTFFSHHICTIEGGAILTDDEEIYHILLCLRSHGWTRHLPELNKICKKSKDPFYESYRFILPGYNVRPLELSGAIGIPQLQKLDSFIQARRENAKYFNDIFSLDSNFYLQQEHGESSWFGFSLVIREDCKTPRTCFIKKLHDANIEVRPIVSGNFLQSDALNYLTHRIYGEHKNSQYIHDNGFFVGNHHFDIRNFLDNLKEALNI